jgi:hypothetical protein
MRRRGVLTALGIAVAGLLLGMLQWNADRQQRRAIMALAPAERRALVERTLRNLDLLCDHAMLSRQCEDEARLLLLVPECDRACQQRARRVLPHATR